MKTETVAEFLARGGKITKIPTVPQEGSKDNKVHIAATSGIASIISLEDAELYSGNSEKLIKKEVKSVPRVDVNLLPDELKRKILEKLNNQDT